MAKTRRAATGQAAAPAATVPTEAAQTTGQAAAGQADPNAAKPAAEVETKPEAKPDAGAAENGLANGKTISVVSVSGNPRRRAGRVFAREAVELAVDALSEDELAAILGDDQLRVSAA